MAGRLAQARAVPEGLLYRPQLLSEAEERELVAVLESLEFEKVVMRGQAARRTVRHYGRRYGYGERRLAGGEAMPPWLDAIRERAEALAGLPSGAFGQALVTRYPPGASIGWHRDAPAFGPVLAGISLGAQCRMRLRRDLDGVRYVHEQALEPRSAYVLGGTARSEWQHSIPPVAGLRHSLTFRMPRD